MQAIRPIEAVINHPSERKKAWREHNARKMRDTLAALRRQNGRKKDLNKEGKLA